MRSLLISALFLIPAICTAQQGAPPAMQPQPDTLQAKNNDFANLHRYRADNEKLPAAGSDRVVFYGDSLTDNWGRKAGLFFPGKPYVNRGIGGQTTPQMLIRFQQDVVHLQPAAVVILAGTNDLAGNTGPQPMSAIQDNFRSMVAIAKAAHIRVILCSVLPADRFPWHPGIAPVDQIRELNTWLAAYAQAEHLVYLNYYPALATPTGAMQPDLALDKAVHPNDAGYALMQPLAEQAIAKSLAMPAP